MALQWIGTRTQEGGDFNPAGLGCARPNLGSSAELLPRGSLLMEVTIRPTSHPINLLRFAALDPWPSGLTVCLEPDGTVRLMMRQGGKHLATSLKTNLGGKAQTAHITYTWDAPARSGRISVYIPDNGILWQTAVLAPFPISMRDAQRIVTAPETCAMDRDLTFAAIADAPCPHGPLPGLSGAAAVDTPFGPKALRDIVAGDYVTVDGTEAVRVLWVGHTSVPALGRFTPMTLRRPYMGLWEDLIAARDQRACLAGSEVEYMFGEERVSTAIRHLEVRNCATPTKNAPAIVTYYQILLETHEIITVNGAMVESFDGSAVLSAPDFLKFSVLADMPIELCPKQVGLAAPVLQGYEALTLTGVSIG
ncbi:Hint domain-containing protein [Octadecabacter sp. CECT 8868]|uniref:Hint domain-containing protein n=1 Tax=Octadecabacter algicola TaxID=2909342 RepID=UPI001F1DE817|nr:Hint domain-containing protein [Octadecabacter algicola]MCF2905891.1 Hint domain-containing protein [Octadecabacter algicola]